MKLSRDNAHPRDARIEFEESSHSYYLDDRSYVFPQTVSGVAARHFSKFDPDGAFKRFEAWRSDKNGKYFKALSFFDSISLPKESQIVAIKASWALNGSRQAAAGTAVHRAVELYLNDEAFDAPVFQPKTGEEPLFGLESQDEKALREFIASGCRGPSPKASPMPAVGDCAEMKLFFEWLSDNADLTPYRTEWSVYSEPLELAGQIDAVFTRETSGEKEFILIDWKRVKDLDVENRFGRFGSGPFSKVPDTKFGHYSVQLSLYRMILHRHYGIKVSEMRLVQLHPDLPHYIQTNVTPIC
jgi:ATP-dependent exoDNAse (exonuclease V) beta subunit